MFNKNRMFSPDVDFELCGSTETLKIEEKNLIGLEDKLKEKPQRVQFENKIESYVREKKTDKLIEEFINHEDSNFFQFAVEKYGDQLKDIFKSVVSRVNMCQWKGKDMNKPQTYIACYEKKFGKEFSEKYNMGMYTYG